MFLRALVAFLALPGIVAFAAPVWMAWRTLPPSGLRWLGLGPMALGALALLRCVRDFYTTGGGTLAIWAPPKHLVTIGLYRHTRNPMYVSVLTLLLGWAALAGSAAMLLYAIGVGLVFHLHVVLREEPWAARTFGAAWSAYRHSVPRWLGRTRR